VNIVIHLRLLVHLLGHLLVYLFVKLLDPDMEFVKNFTHPDFQAKSFTPQKCVICDSFFSQINSVNASNINNFGIFWL